MVGLTLSQSSRDLITACLIWCSTVVNASTASGCGWWGSLRVTSSAEAAPGGCSADSALKEGGGLSTYPYLFAFDVVGIIQVKTQLLRLGLLQAVLDVTPSIAYSPPRSNVTDT